MENQEVPGWWLASEKRRHQQDLRRQQVIDISDCKETGLGLVCLYFFVTTMTVDFPAEHWAGGSFMMSFSSLFIRF